MFASPSTVQTANDQQKLTVAFFSYKSRRKHEYAAWRE